MSGTSDIVLAIDIGGTKVAAALVTAAGEIVARDQFATADTSGDEAQLFDAVVALADRVGASSPTPPVVCGVGCGGPSRERNTIVSPLNIPAWTDFPLRDRLRDRLGLGVHVDNDAKAFALAEGWLGAARGVDDYIAMVVSTGVGGGIVLEGRLLEGADGNAGHIGHVVVEPGGHPDASGARGSLEGVASGTALAAITGRPAHEADREVRVRTGRYVGLAVASVANLLDLRMAVVSGSVALGFGADFFDAAQEVLDDQCRLLHSRGTVIVPGALGDDGPLVGAAAVGLRGVGRLADPRRSVVWREAEEGRAMTDTTGQDLEALAEMAESLKGMLPPSFDSVEDERRHRKERLVAGLRIVAKRGLTTGIAGHITARDPELLDHFWVNPFITPFSRISVSDLLLVNHDGQVVEGDRPVNGAAFAIHAAIHKAFPDLNGAAHSHSPNGRPWSATGRLLEMTSQDACMFHDSQVLFEGFTGVVLDEDEGDRIADALARPTPWREGNKVAILENHGHLTVGETVDEAVFWFVAFDQLCRDQLMLEATGKPYGVLDDEVAGTTRDLVGSRYAGWLSFQGLYEEIAHEQPDLFD